MTVLRVQKRENNYVVIKKECSENTQITWGAKGLHSYLMGLPEDWKVQVSHLQKQAKNGRDAVRNYLGELEKAGYITKEWKRDSETGKFVNLEYIVHEVSQTLEKTSLDGDPNPTPENPSSVNLGVKFPEPDSPSLGFPAPVKSTLININNNKYINNKTTADKILVNTNNAAVSSNQFLVADGDNIVDIVSKPEDSIIGEELTDFQLKRISNLMSSLNGSKDDKLVEEIKFCLLDPKQFTGCGNDFAKKLNAIKKVIRQGRWQTPKGMIHNKTLSMDKSHIKLEDELRSAYAEVRHFENLMDSAKEVARENFERIINKAKHRINNLEQELLKLCPSLYQTGCAGIPGDFK